MLGVVALAGAALIPSAPAGAATGPVTFVDPGTTFVGVVTVGANTWAYAPGGCGTNPLTSYLDEFNSNGQIIDSVGLGLASVSCGNPEPITTDGTVVAALNGESATVVNGVTGVPMNTFVIPDINLEIPFPAPLPEASLALSGTTLAVVDYEGTVWAMDTNSGSPLWHVTNVCPVPVGATVDQGGLSVLCYPRGIQGVDMATGALTYGGPSYTPDTQPGASITSSGAYAYVTIGSGSYVYRLSLPDLSYTGDAYVPGGGDLTALGIVGSTLWVASANVNAIWPIDLASGNPGQMVALPSPATSIAGGGNSLWAVLESGALVKLTVSPPPLFLPSTVTLSAPSGASPVVGSPTTLTATLSTPGTVTFYDGSSAIAGCSGLSATTTVTCAWSPTGVGAHSLTATLTPTDAGYLHSTSPAITLTVAPEATSVTASFPSGSVASGHVSLTATGSVPGTLTFTEGGSALAGCVGLPAPSGTATCVTDLGPGAHQVTVALAPYSANDAPSSASAGVKVVPATLTGSVPFARGSSALDVAGRRALARLVRAAAADGYTRVRLVGLGDGPGSAALARARAATVAAALRHDLSGVVVSTGARPLGGSRVLVVASL